MPKKHRRRLKKRPSDQSSLKKKLFAFLWRFGVVLLVVLAAYLTYLDVRVLTQFDGKKWSLPARVYARPLELYVGAPYSRNQVLSELKLLGYRNKKQLSTPGSYNASRSVIAVNKRAFEFWDGIDDSRPLRITFNANEVTRITSSDGSASDLVRFDPLYIGGIYPEHAEDRILLKLEEVPELLINGLISVEDKNFHQHYGVSPKSIARAMFSNIKAGKSVQGGSTLTQQLVKNFFLSNERTLKRKLNEALMSVLLELHYDKPEILQAYLNEIYLGQAGKRAIHGFGLASHFYFERPLTELDLPKIALLIGMVKGPSVYNPRRNPKNATSRRNLVIDIMQQDGLITAQQAAQAKQARLGVTGKAPVGTSRFPAFMQLLKAQLKQDYEQQDLETEGLKVFSTLDPLAQEAAETSLGKRLSAIEKDRKLKRNTLQGAVIMTSSHNGEVLAMVGGREARYSGFNRALNARRQVGSILKPAIYATAYAQYQRYSMLTPIDDSPLQVRSANDQLWQPKNYDGKYHGLVPLYSSLAHSYNVSTARLGLNLGLENVFTTLYQLGVTRQLPPYPSVLLGAAELTPLEVAGMYQTLAANGFQTPVRAIRDVLDSENNALQRYPIRLQQVLDPAVAYLTNASLIEVMRNGTGKSFYWQFPDSMVVAGKTGTTNELRDSWFAGFSNDKLAVVWVGNDDNRPIKLTGSNGALRVWTDMMKKTGIQSLRLNPPENVEFKWIEQSSGLLSAKGCEDAVQFPFIKGSAPTAESSCITENRPINDTIKRKVKSFWESIFGD
jgi:penicillin-binding protein 1B